LDAMVSIVPPPGDTEPRRWKVRCGTGDRLISSFCLILHFSAPFYRQMMQKTMPMREQAA